MYSTLLHVKVNITLKIPAKEFPPAHILQKHIDLIESETDTSIAIVLPPAHRSSLASEYRTTIVITGLPDLAEHARVRVLVALDEIVSLYSIFVINRNSGEMGSYVLVFS